jgi:hypothetical protein
MSEQSKLERASHVAFLIVCVVLTAYISVRSYAHWATPDRPERPAPYKAGEILDPIAGLDFRTSPYTLIAFIRSDCPYCEASKPFYRELARTHSSSVVRFIGFGVEPAGQLRSYLADVDATFDDVVSYSGGTLKIRTVPSLLLIDAGGVVKNSWAGQLSSKQEREVKRVLASLRVPDHSGANR